MIAISQVFDGDINDVQFFVVVATIILAVLNVMTTGRAGEGFAPFLYRLAFAFVAFSAGLVFIAFYDANQNARPPGVFFMFSVDLLLLARLHALKVSRRWQVPDSAEQKGPPPPKPTGRERLRHWLTH